MSPMIKELPFTHNETSYIIQVTSDAGEVRVQAIRASDREPCGFEYSVRLNGSYYLDSLCSSDVIKSLLSEAARDVIDNRWARDIDALSESVIAKRIDYSQKYLGGSDSFDHIETFDRPITQSRYEEHLACVDYHGYPPMGYARGIRQGDLEGKVWIYRASRSCD